MPYLLSIPLIDKQAWGRQEDRFSTDSVYVRPESILSIREYHKKYLPEYYEIAEKVDDASYRRSNNVSCLEQKQKTIGTYASPNSGPFQYTELILTDGQKIKTLKRADDLVRFIEHH